MFLFVSSSTGGCGGGEHTKTGPIPMVVRLRWSGAIILHQFLEDVFCTAHNSMLGAAARLGVT